MSADEAGCPLHDAFDILRVIVLPAEDDHVLDASTDEELAVVKEAHVAGSEVAIIKGAVVDQARMKLLESQFRIVPVALAFAASGEPNFSNMVRLESYVPLRIDDLYVETGERSSTTDDLGGSGDLGDFGGQTDFA